MDDETLFAFEGVRSRAEIAQVLRRLAGQLDAGGDVSFTDDGRGATVRPPDRLELELEVEREGERDDPGAEFEIEVEIEWTGGEEASESAGQSEAAEADRDVASAPEPSIRDTGGDGGAADAEPASEPGSERPGDAATDEDGRGEGPTAERAAIGTPDPGPVDVGATPAQATFDLYRDRAGEWRWRLVHRNGNIIATSGEGYARRSGAENGLRSVVRNAPGAEVVVDLQEERDDGEDEEDGDQDLRDLHADAGDPAGADDSGDDREDEE